MENNRCANFVTMMQRARQYNISRILTEDITMPEYMILAEIYELCVEKKREHVWVSDLVVSSDVTPQAISKYLRISEKKGYLERYINKEDRRIIGVSITSQGIEIFRKTTMEIDEFIASIFQEFSEGEYQSFKKYVDKFGNVLEKNYNEKLQKKTNVITAVK